jgi:hypothetical protein
MDGCQTKQSTHYNIYVLPIIFLLVKYASHNYAMVSRKMNVWNVKKNSNTNSSLSGMITDVTDDDGSNDSNNSTTETFYEVKCDPYKFVVCVMRIPMKRADKISFGGKKECVNYSFFWDDHTAQLSGLGHDDTCSISRTVLARGNGTCKMLKTSLLFLKWLYPNIKHVLLLDTSTVSCSKAKRIPLPLLYIAKHKMTWYEARFGAVPHENPGYYDALLRVNNALDAPIAMSFKSFFDAYMGVHKIVIKDAYLVFEKLYKQSLTVREFVKKTLQEYPDCIMLYKWFPYFMSKNGTNMLNIEYAYFEIGRKWIDDIALEITVKQTDTKPFTDRVAV